MNEYYKNDFCRISKKKDLELVMPFKDTPYCNGYSKEKYDRKIYPMGIYLSESSGLLQLADVINPETIYGDYIYVSSTSFGLGTHFINFSKKVIEELEIKNDSFIFEIGSNDGILLNAFKQQNMKVIGMDPAKKAIKNAKDNFNVDTVEDFFSYKTSNDIKNKYGKPKIIIANNIFANIDDLHGFVKGLKNLLAYDGFFIFETSYIVGLLENMVFDFMYHEHLSYFGLKPIEYLFNEHDMEVFHAERIDTKGGSIRTYIKHKEYAYPINDSVKNLKTEEENRKIYNPQTYKIFFEKIEIEKQKMLSFLKQAKEEGKKITAYGASDTTTTLFSHFEVAKYIECMFDDNKDKVGRFSPLLNIPVLDSKEIYNIKPDYIILSAWRFKEPILKKHSECKATFIMPLPKFEIL